MTDRSSEPTLILQASDIRIVVHGSLFLAWNGDSPAQPTYSWWAFAPIPNRCTMALSEFIRGHHHEIIGEFEEFARTLIPPGANMTAAELRDHAEEMLSAVVEDVETGQSENEQLRKSRGMGMQKTMAASGVQHADARIRHGFTPAQLLAEFRALRASVLRLYERSGRAGPRRHSPLQRVN